ncbi:YdcF family protein [Mycobacterium sp. 236(2023)]|uniref:YdcF family protein n=1 Tax=Mycobacterium sp. 236(2023) TaxID=3038163 RepID=UPI002415765C|nr:YdcF family protein [Mycobacterium sp. 236(2023)]MDG4666716.1 YdcF family protein [Mycobacterium sp. 236(2023)]
MLAFGLVAVGGASAGTAQAAPVVSKDFTKPAIVILGYGLKPDGTMRLILHTRVLAGMAIGHMFPQSPIIVTGGNPRNGNTEAGQMRKMLRLYGIPEERIIVEDRANSTVQNAAFSVPLAKNAGTSGIILVTSSSHQDRADGNFADAGGNILATVSFPDNNPSTNVTQFVKDVLSPFVPVT